MTHAPAPAPGPSGLLLIDKPLRRTSMDVCRSVRRRLIAAGAPKRVKVGHAGTLDPLATGLLVVMVGKATRLCAQVMDGTKEYLAEADLSFFTATDDLEAPPEPVAVATPPTRLAVEAAARALTGLVMQAPPAYSAMKIGGERAYRLARSGAAVRPEARPVRIEALDILSYAWPHLALRILCGKGTYIRSLARDLGRSLGTGGCLISLRRTRTGPFDVAAATPLEALPPTLAQADLLPVP